MILSVCVFWHVQGLKIGVVKSHHRIEILKIHAKAPSQCDAAGDSHVEANSDPMESQRKVGVVMPPVPMAAACDAVHNVTMQQIAASAVFTASEAAHGLTMPVIARGTEGQRMLQAGFGGEILGIESREKISTSSDVDGSVREDRFEERSVVGEGGQAVLVQQVQESAPQLPAMPDIEMAANEQFAVLNAQVVSSLKNLLGLDTSTTKAGHKIDAVESIMEAMGDEICATITKLHNESQAKFKALESTMEADDNDKEANMVAGDRQRQIKDQKRDASDIERRNDGAQRCNDNAPGRTDDAETRTNDAERDAKNAECDKLLALLQLERSKNKRPADNQGEGILLKKPKNVYPSSNGFMWEKTIKGIRYRQKGFKSFDEAEHELGIWLDNHKEQDTSMTDAA